MSCLLTPEPRCCPTYGVVYRTTIGYTDGRPSDCFIGGFLSGSVRSEAGFTVLFDRLQVATKTNIGEGSVSLTPEHHALIRAIATGDAIRIGRVSPTIRVTSEEVTPADPVSGPLPMVCDFCEHVLPGHLVWKSTTGVRMCDDCAIRPGLAGGGAGGPSGHILSFSDPAKLDAFATELARRVERWHPSGSDELSLRDELMGLLADDDDEPPALRRRIA